MLVLGDGAIVGSGTEEELSARLLSSRRIVVGVRPHGPLADAVAAIRAVAGVVEVVPGGEADGAQELAISAAADVRAEVCRTLVAGGHDVLSLGRAQHKLESIFLELVKEERRAGN